MNIKPQDFLKSVYFSAKFVFLPMGAKMLSNAGLCWQPGQWKRLLDMEEAADGKLKAWVKWGLSHASSCVSLKGGGRRSSPRRHQEEREDNMGPSSLGFPDSKAKTMATNTQEPGTLDLSWVLT